MEVKLVPVAEFPALYIGHDPLSCTGVGTVGDTAHSVFRCQDTPRFLVPETPETNQTWSLFLGDARGTPPIHAFRSSFRPQSSAVRHSRCKVTRTCQPFGLPKAINGPPSRTLTSGTRSAVVVCCGHGRPWTLVSGRWPACSWTGIFVFCECGLPRTCEAPAGLLLDCNTTFL